MKRKRKKERKKLKKSLILVSYQLFVVAKVIEFEKGIENENAESSTEVGLNSGVNSADGLIGKTATKKLHFNCTIQRIFIFTKLQGCVSW